MKNIAIVTDSTSDLSVRLVEKTDITIVPLSVIFEGNKYIDDGESILLNDFYRRLKKSDAMSLSTQPSPGDFTKVYIELLKEYQSIISIHISSKLSGTFNSAVLARRQLKEATIEVIDSEMVHMSCEFLAIEVSRMASEGMELKEIVARVEKFKQNIDSFYCPRTLDNLIKGGRMSKIKGTFAKMLEVKPILTLREGEISLYKKVRKWDQAKDAIADAIKEKADGSNNITLSIGDVDAEGEADAISERLAREIKPKEILRTDIGIVVGSHLGIGGLGVTCYIQ